MVMNFESLTFMFSKLKTYIVNSIKNGKVDGDFIEFVKRHYQIIPYTFIGSVVINYVEDTYTIRFEFKHPVNNKGVILYFENIKIYRTSRGDVIWVKPETMKERAVAIGKE